MTRLLPVLGNIAVLAVGLAALFGLPAFAETYVIINATIFASFAILALSLALIWGYAGILCFGQAAFFGLGGYTYAVAAINFGDTTGAAALAVALPALFAALLGYFMFWGRISDVYLGVITLTVSLILYRFLNQTAGEQWNIGEAPLGGFNGIPSTPILNWPGRPGEQLAPENIFSLAAGLLILVYFGCKALLATRFGRVVVAIRENEARVALLGYDTRRYKLAIFVVGGALAGLSGLMFANSVFVSPTMFSLPVSGQIIIWVIIGGLGTLIGPVIGCILMQILTNWLGTLNQVPGFGWIDPNLVLGVILMVFVLLVPKGLMALAADAWRWVRVLAFPRRGKVPEGRKGDVRSASAHHTDIDSVATSPFRRFAPPSPSGGRK
ncbi:branched-chain amino acid ABC transporter permease [Vineibacter terrae]|uniref:branched-chain amino acid ABC transporter permease n=1 Tax=Vineibacter terrae TaxID=2586908 RepID=UPI002E32EF6A|nr:branched-chain amino acid ABC transporter permease [Vineibacter terrae]HEX2891651.1 branched-chain amino acid ABC transporter permease [Vineibacter terrae]